MKFETMIEKIRSMTPEERLASVTIDEINLSSNSIEICWSGVQGFGSYTLYREPVFDTDENGFQSIVDYRWRADSEHMDSSKSDKRFLRHLFNEFIDEITIDG